MKKNQHSLIYLLLLGLLLCCSEPEKALPRSWTQSDKSSPEGEEGEIDGESELIVPNIFQDGTKIISRHSLGFKRSDEKRQGKYEMRVSTVKSTGATDESKAKYFISKLDRNSENCMVQMRKDSDFVFYDLDCVRTPNNSQSRYFDLGFTQDDLLLFNTSDCKFEDLQQTDKNDYKSARQFSIECESSGSGLTVSRYLKINSWFHPSSPHPSGLVELNSSVCDEKPCQTTKTYTIHIIEDEWRFTDPKGYERLLCPFKADLYKRTVRCGNETCFDSKLLGYAATSICKCSPKITNIPVKYVYLSAEGLEKDDTVAIEFLDEQECQNAVMADSACQECFTSEYLSP